eukprot:scaffold19898_cov34-Tisochrysis_lutea.AAC.3
MYEWPTTQPRSEAHIHASPGLTRKKCRIVQVSTAACPPESRTTPLGAPVVPDVYRMYSGCSDGTGTQGCSSAMGSERNGFTAEHQYSAPTEASSVLNWSESSMKPATLFAVARRSCTSTDDGRCELNLSAPSSRGR